MKNLKFVSFALDSIQTLSRNEAKKIVGAMTAVGPCN
jgi:hypothetical protein